jgi:phosphatidylglycerophosphatase C
MRENAKQLMLFDFDGTLTNTDSLWHFIWFAVPLPRLLWQGSGWIRRLLFLAVRGQIHAESAKKLLLSQFFKGMTREELERLGSLFFRRKLPPLLRANVLRLLRHFVRQPDTRVVLVSASADVWLKAFCEAEQIGLICTELRYTAGRFDGQFVQENCNGAAKAARIRAALDIAAYSRVVAYGNSSGDQAMFDLAHEAWRVKKSGAMVQVKGAHY